MTYRWVPDILLPNYTWPCPIRTPVSTKTPPIPKISYPLVRRIWGFIHRRLYEFSGWYTELCKEDSDLGIAPLPFGLVLKWSNRTSLSEAIATQMVRSAGIPAPKVLCYGDHPGHFKHFSILMTRLPGDDLYNSSRKFVVEDEQPLFGELEECVNAMRQWESPFPDGMVCSPIGGAIRSVRVPGRIMGPFESEDELFDYLLKPAWNHGFKSEKDFEETKVRASKLCEKKHRIVFTHGDLKSHNILVTEDYHLGGFIDWESAGWCPEFWDYTTALRWGEKSWWHQVMRYMSREQYVPELDADRALNNLTVDSYVGF